MEDDSKNYDNEISPRWITCHCHRWGCHKGCTDPAHGYTGTATDSSGSTGTGGGSSQCHSSCHCHHWGSSGTNSSGFVTPYTNGRPMNRDFWMRMEVINPVYMNKDFTANLIVPSPYDPIQRLKVKIPYPYEQFTDTKFFLTDATGYFISDAYYDITDNDRYVTFKAGSPIGLVSGSDIRFTFCHNQEYYHIQKFEYHIKCKEGIHEYKIKSPFNKIRDLNLRYRVFFRRVQMNQDKDAKQYNIDNYTGILYIDSHITVKEGDDLDIVCFYTGNEINKSIPELPMSGYIYLKKNEIDRNYNNNLMAVFINGKLIPRSNIIHESNNVYKISKDIKTRYNLDIRNMSPRISSLVPFYKRNVPRVLDYNIQQWTTEIPCKIFVPSDNYDKAKHRYRIEDICNPIFIQYPLLTTHQDYYLTLVHHGYSENNNPISYTLKFFQDDYIKYNSEVKVLTELRYRTEGYEEEYELSPTRILMGMLPKVMGNTSEDIPLFSIQIKNIIENDTYRNDKHKDINGLKFYFEILPTQKDRRQYIYYELISSNYEINNYVGVFDIVISSEKNGNGIVHYRKRINLLPMNRKEIEKED